jgi:hypothetical protein
MRACAGEHMSPFVMCACAHKYLRPHADGHTTCACAPLMHTSNRVDLSYPNVRSRSLRLCYAHDFLHANQNPRRPGGHGEKGEC